MDYKACPKCNALTSLETQVCVTCGHRYVTQFQPAPPNQTQAFSTPQPPPNMNAGQYYAPYPHPYPQQGALTGLPDWACFVIGFLIPIVGIVFAILCFSLDSMRDPAKARMFLFGAIASFLLGCLGWAFFVGLAFIH